MNLHGLKDENGKDVKLVVTDDPFVHPHPIIRVESIESIEPKSEYRVPGWFVNEPDEIFYAFKKEETEFKNYTWFWLCTNNEKDTKYNSKFCHPATPQEIEAHLRKICVEKYVGKKIKKIDGDFVSGFECVITNEKHHQNYYPQNDDYWMIGDNHLGACVYKQGKFAEIVPDEPKELPKNVQELNNLIFDYVFYAANPTLRGRTVSIDDFLKEQGYKTA